MGLLGRRDGLGKWHPRTKITTDEIEPIRINAAGSPRPRSGGAKMRRQSSEGVGVIGVQMVEDIVLGPNQGGAGAGVEQELLREKSAARANPPFR